MIKYLKNIFSEASYSISNDPKILKVIGITFLSLFGAFIILTMIVMYIFSYNLIKYTDSTNKYQIEQNGISLTYLYRTMDAHSYYPESGLMTTISNMGSSNVEIDKINIDVSEDSSKIEPSKYILQLNNNETFVFNNIEDLLLKSKSNRWTQIDILFENISKFNENYNFTFEIILNDSKKTIISNKTLLKRTNNYDVSI